jgi:hypothetical protein
MQGPRKPDFLANQVIAVGLYSKKFDDHIRRLES